MNVEQLTTINQLVKKSREAIERLEQEIENERGRIEDVQKLCPHPNMTSVNGQKFGTCKYCLKELPEDTSTIDG